MIDGYKSNENNDVKNFAVSWQWIFASSEQHLRIVTMALPQVPVVFETLTDLSEEIGIDQISVNPTDTSAAAMPLWAFIDELDTFDLREVQGQAVSLGEILRQTLADTGKENLFV